MAVPSLRDFETLEKFAAKLCVPLFAAASVLQPPLEHGLPDWLTSAVVLVFKWLFRVNGDVPPLSILIGAGLWGLIWAGICSAFLWFLWAAGLLVIGHTWAEWLRPVLLPTTGLFFMSMGTLAICKIPALHVLAVNDPVPSLNLLWELGLFTFGLWCMQLSNNTPD